MNYIKCKDKCCIGVNTQRFEGSLHAILLHKLSTVSYQVHSAAPRGRYFNLKAVCFGTKMRQRSHRGSTCHFKGAINTKYHCKSTIFKHQFNLLQDNMTCIIHYNIT